MPTNMHTSTPSHSAPSPSKAVQFLGKLESRNKATYGFKSRKCPQAVDELIGFEDNLISLIKYIEFRNVSNTFQE